MFVDLPAVRRLLTAGTALLLLTAAAACGGDDADSATTTAAASTASTTAASTTAGGAGDATTVARTGAATTGAPASSDAATTPPAAATTTAGAATEAATRVVETSKGQVTIPAHAERVVTVADFPMLTMFDLGLTPIGIYSAGEEYVNPRLLDWWQAIPKISDGTVGGPVNLEAVAALQPDLILGIDAQQVDYDQLSAIAPTVLLTFTDAAWKDIAVQTADVLGVTDRLADLQAAYDRKVEEVRTTHANLLAGTSWDLLQGGFEEGNFWLYGAGSPVVDILTSAGLQLASASAGTGDQARQTVSLEHVDTLADADGIIYYTTNDGQPANLGPKLFESPLFQQLPPVQAGHLIGTVNFLPSSYQEAIDLLDDLAAGLDAYA